MSKRPIEPAPFNIGVRVVDIGDVRVARGKTRLKHETCKHNRMVYDQQYAGGSMILLEAADEIAALRAQLADLSYAAQGYMAATTPQTTKCSRRSLKTWPALNADWFMTGIHWLLRLCERRKV